jgi:hypothetical protein
MREAMPFAAAIFISSVMSRARISSAPRKMPGNASRLLTWFGKSERPVQTTRAPAALASSGRISGTGFAMAMTTASLFMVFTMSFERQPATETPMKTSAPLMTSASWPFSFFIGDLRDGFLVRVHAVRAPLVDGAAGITEDDVARIHLLQQARDGLPGGAGAVHDDLCVLEFLADELERVDERGDDDDGRAVLIVVEDRDVEFLAQGVLDVEALRRLDVLEVDAAEGGRDELAGADDLIDALRVEADRHRIDAREALEEDRLALHDRQARARADVAEAEHGGAVRHDGDHVALRRVVVDGGRILLDREAGRGDAGGVCQGKIVGVIHRNLAL